jgi:hypothetical protein
VSKWASCRQFSRTQRSNRQSLAQLKFTASSSAAQSIRRPAGADWSETADDKSISASFLLTPSNARHPLAVSPRDLLRRFLPRRLGEIPAAGRQATKSSYNPKGANENPFLLPLCRIGNRLCFADLCLRTNTPDPQLRQAIVALVSPFGG